jgi:probable F420-dependent oxidoreductase
VHSPLELLMAAAMVTKRVELGTSVLVVGMHTPVDLAKRLTTLDHFSGGRLKVGLGVGWSQEEYEAAGIDWGSRGRRCDEFIEALVACWGPDPVSFEGDFFRIVPSFLGPKPIQQPHPPLLIGMLSPPGIDRTIRYGDGWLPAGLSIARVHQDVTAMNAQREGRKALTVHLLVFVQPPIPTLRPLTAIALEDLIRRAAASGLDEVIIDLNFSQEMSSAMDWRRAPERLSWLLHLGSSGPR